MRSIPARALLASGPVAAVAVGLLAAKVWAVLLGPAGFGALGVLQTLVTLLALAGGLGLGTAVTQAGAGPVSDGRLASLRTSGLLGAGSASALLAITGMALAPRVSSSLLAGAISPLQVALAAAAIPFAAMTPVVSGEQAARERIGRVASIGLASSILPLLSLLIAVVTSGIRWIGLAMLIGSAAQLMVALAIARPARAVPKPGTSIGALAGIGAPHAGSVLLELGLLLAFPSLVVRALGVDAAGLYRSASVPSLYAAMVFIALAHAYQPRVAAAARDRIRELSDREIAALAVVVVPLSGLVEAFSPRVLAMIYTPEFSEAAGLLRWHLRAELLHVGSWTLSFVLLTRMSSSSVLAVRAIGAIAALAVALLALGRGSLDGLGFAWTTLHLTTLVLTAALLRRRDGRWPVGRREALLLAGPPATWIAIEALAPEPMFWRLAATALWTAFAMRTAWIRLAPGIDPHAEHG